MYTEELTNILGQPDVGKVRETYFTTLAPRMRLQVATNRVSTHEEVHLSLIPNKGAVLTALTVYWLTTHLADRSHHLVASGEAIYDFLPGAVRQVCPDLHHQAVIIRYLEMEPYEFIIRRFMPEASSLRTEYLAGNDPYGLNLPDGLPVMHRFDPPIFTPTEKGEDEDPPVPHRQIRNRCTTATTQSFDVFRLGEHVLRERGIVLLDKKGEYGRGGTIADEVLTPDCCRFAMVEEVQQAIANERDPDWLDKQALRNEAVKMFADGGKRPLTFSDTAIAATEQRLQQILEMVTGDTLATWHQTGRLNWQTSH